MSDNGDDDLRYRNPTDDPSDTGTSLHEDGPGLRSGGFDPVPYMRQLRGRSGSQDYLDVKWRLLWLRREHPDAEIVTEHVRIDDTSAIFKATVTIPTGGRATGYGSETRGDFGDFIEKAETKAIGRALNALGYGAQFANGDEEPAVTPMPSPPPADRPATTTAAPPESPPPPPAAEAQPAPTPSTEAPPESSHSPRGEPPIAINRRKERAATTASKPPDERAPRAEPDLEDYSWTAFWPWARGLGYNDRRAVEDFLGRSLTGLNPAEVRDLVRAARGE